MRRVFLGCVLGVFLAATGASADQLVITTGHPHTRLVRHYYVTKTYYHGHAVYHRHYYYTRVPVRHRSGLVIRIHK